MEIAIGLIVGFALGVAADIVRQWLGRKTRREERSEAAAGELIALLDEAREPFLDAYRHDADVDSADVRRRVAKVRQKALLLEDDAARTRLELVAEVLSDPHGAQEFTGDTYARIAYIAWQDGRETLRRTLAGKIVQPPSEELLGYKSSIDDGRALWEEHMREQAKRRGRKDE